MVSVYDSEFRSLRVVKWIVVAVLVNLQNEQNAIAAAAITVMPPALGVSIQKVIDARTHLHLF